MAEVGRSRIPGAKGKKKNGRQVEDRGQDKEEIMREINREEGDEINSSKSRMLRGKRKQRRVKGRKFV